MLKKIRLCNRKSEFLSGTYTLSKNAPSSTQEQMIMSLDDYNVLCADVEDGIDALSKRIAWLLIEGHSIQISQDDIVLIALDYTGEL